MNVSSVLRSSAFLLALGAALSAQAVSLHLESTGEVSYDGIRPPIFTEIVTVQEGGFGTLDRYMMGLNYRPDYGDSVLVRGYTGSSGYLAITFLSAQYGGFAGSPTSGTWAVDTASCQGAWVDVVGSGSFTATFFDNTSPHFSGAAMTLDGNVEHAPPGGNPAPEPASLAALGLGALALGRRRVRGR